jgi:biotin transport system substrate-specific component
MENTKKINTRQLTLIGVMAAVTCILGPLSLPIGIVPISLTNLVIYFAVYALG